MATTIMKSNKQKKERRMKGVSVRHARQVDKQIQVVSNSGSVQYLQERDKEDLELGDISEQTKARVKKVLAHFEAQLHDRSRKLKNWIIDTAVELEEAGCPVNKICWLMGARAKKVKGFVTDRYIRRVLPAKYKVEYRSLNADKQTEKLQAKKQEAIAKRARDLSDKTIDDYTIEDLEAITDIVLVKEIAKFWYIELQKALERNSSNSKHDAQNKQ